MGIDFSKVRFPNLTGQRFGRLVVLEYAGKKESGKSYKNMWLCQCDCGNTKAIAHGQLINGHTTSCGCYHKEKFGDLNRTHNLSGKCGRLYPLWKSIKYRCNNPHCKSYPDYGGRGIKMCDEWENDFVAFHDWALANGYKRIVGDSGRNKLSIDRIDVNGNYEPSNCRFVDDFVQANNKRQKAKNPKVWKKCPVCGKDFFSTNNTCSRSCGNKYSYINKPNTKDYTKICPVCGKMFDAKRGGHYKDAICCSKKCASLSISPIWEYNGESHRVVEWAEIIGVNAHCLLHRKELGWTIEEILTTPLRGKRNAKLQTDICETESIREHDSQG